MTRRGKTFKFWNRSTMRAITPGISVGSYPKSQER